MREHGSFPLRKKELQQYQDMKNYVTHEPNSISGVLRIGASQSFSQSHDSALLKGFVDEYSDIEISLTTDTSDRLVKLVKRRHPSCYRPRQPGMARIRYSSGRCPAVPDFSQAY